jgi:replicative DNA helicase
MYNTHSNERDGITLDAHLESGRDLLNKLSAAHNAGTLTAGIFRREWQQVETNLNRDFPPEQSTQISESSALDLLQGYLARAQTRSVAAPTGLGGLDRAFSGGLQGKRLIVLLGAPGSGKTSLANQIAERVAMQRPALYATSEDVPDTLLAKTLARIGKIQYSAVLHGWSDHEMRIGAAIREWAELPSAQNLRYLDVTSGAISLSDLRDRAQAHFEGKPGPGLIVIDYLQRMARAIRESSGTSELREAVTLLTEKLRALACELDCTVLAVASMHRASGYGKSSDVSALSSAKESGDIEYTADVVMALTDDTTNKRAVKSFLKPRTLRIDKNRLGETTALDLDWYADRQQFTEVAKEEGR